MFFSNFDDPIDDLPNNADAFFEYDCSHSRAISRLAINKKTRQLYAIYNGSDNVYRYASIPKVVEESIELKKMSLGKIMSLVRKDCRFSVMDAFPDDTILVYPKEYHNFLD